MLDIIKQASEMLRGTAMANCESMADKLDALVPSALQASVTAQPGPNNDKAVVLLISAGNADLMGCAMSSKLAERLHADLGKALCIGESAAQQSDAWQAVCDALGAVYPSWSTMAASGQEAAVRSIHKLAAEAGGGAKFKRRIHNLMDAAGIRAMPDLEERVSALIDLRQRAEQNCQEWETVCQDAHNRLTAAGVPQELTASVAQRVQALANKHNQYRDQVIESGRILGLEGEPEYPDLLTKLSGVKAGADQLVHIAEMVGPCPTSVYDKVREIMVACQDAQAALTNPNEIVQGWPEGWVIEVGGSVGGTVLKGPHGQSANYPPHCLQSEFYRQLLAARKPADNRGRTLVAGKLYDISPKVTAMIGNNGEWVVNYPGCSLTLKDTGRAHRALQYIVEGLAK